MGPGQAGWACVWVGRWRMKKGREQRRRGVCAGRGHFGDSPLTVAVIMRERGEAKWEGLDHCGARSLSWGQGIVRL